jgi:CheY-like chemotaxis protein
MTLSGRKATNPQRRLPSAIPRANMSGVELSKRLKTSIPHLKVIFASGYGGDELAKQLSVATDAVLLSKPFSKNSLLALVHAVLH